MTDAPSSEEPDPIATLWHELDANEQGRQTKRNITANLDRTTEALIAQLQPFAGMIDDLRHSLAVAAPMVDTSKLVESWPLDGIDNYQFLPNGVAELSAASGQLLNSWRSDYLRLAEEFSQITLPAITTPTWTIDFPAFDVERWIKVIPPELIGEGERRLDRLPELDRIALMEGISVAWACPGRVIDRLLAADTAEDRKQLLVAHETDILNHCHHALNELDADEELLAWVRLVHEAISVAQSGFHRAAQAMVANTIDSLVMRVLGGSSNASKNGGVDVVLDEEPIRYAMMVLTLRPLVTAFTPFNPNWGTPVPETFSRHATVHQLAHPAVCRPEHAISGIMLATALIFLVDRWDLDQEASS